MEKKDKCLLTEIIFGEFEKVRKNIPRKNIKRIDKPKMPIEEFAEEFAEEFLIGTTADYHKRKQGLSSLKLKTVFELQDKLGIEIIKINPFAEELINKILKEKENNNN